MASTARVVRAACPHDCPDTCAMHVSVEDGRAVAVAGDPEHPITVGFLCGKVSNYLDRVYSQDRILHPLVRAGGELKRASWDEALERVGDWAARGQRRARRRVDPAVLIYGHAGIDPGRQHERARDERARRECPRADDLRDRRGHGSRDGARRLAGGRPRGVAARPLRDRLGLEPDVDGAAPLAQAARRPQGRRTDRGGRSLPEPHRAGGGRAPATAAGDGCRARARDDARDRRRGTPGRGLVPRPHRRLRRAARDAGRVEPRAR